MLSKNVAAGSTAEQSIDSDANEHPDRDRDRIHIGRLTPGIERREQEQADHAARERGRNDFGDDESAAPWTSMPVCKVALAVGTSRHLIGRSGPQVSTP
jgi:hypothetical protein